MFKTFSSMWWKGGMRDEEETDRELSKLLYSKK